MGSSLVKEMSNDSGLNVTAYERGWDVRFRRGGTISHLEEFVEREELSKYRVMILCGGSNNLSNAARTKDPGTKEQQVDTLHRTTRRIVRAAVKANIKVLVALPPPRRDVPEELRAAASTRLEKMIKEEGGAPFKMEGQMDPSDYIAKLPDGIHFTKDHWREVLQAMLRTLGIDNTLRNKDERLLLAEAFPGVCHICGVKHPKGAHQDFRQCTACNRGMHAANVCMTKFQMCRDCGRRGHAQETCRKNLGCR